VQTWLNMSWRRLWVGICTRNLSTNSYDLRPRKNACNQGYHKYKSNGQINVRLTSNRYYSHMQQRTRGRDKTGSGTSFWLALAAALGLHAIFLLLPMTKQATTPETSHARIELQLTKYSPPEPAVEPAPEPPEPNTEAEGVVAKAMPHQTEAALPAPAQVAVPKEEIATRVEARRDRVTQSILAARFFRQEPEADKLFGRPLKLPDTATYNRFQQPVGENMMTLLDRPLPDLPFAYTPGVVKFAYDPGIRGDLQRFWDVITPEFGWRTDNGTEVRCIWVLVVVGCGWK
jgi:hypothetical protein